jgi:hypothetical protein
MSSATPTTSRHSILSVEPGKLFLLAIARPTASRPGHRLRARLSLTIATFGVVLVSRSSKSRPARTEMPIARKYPGEMRARVVGIPSVVPASRTVLTDGAPRAHFRRVQRQHVQNADASRARNCAGGGEHLTIERTASLGPLLRHAGRIGRLGRLTGDRSQSAAEDDNLPRVVAEIVQLAIFIKARTCRPAAIKRTSDRPTWAAGSFESIQLDVNAWKSPFLADIPIIIEGRSALPRS